MLLEIADMPDIAGTVFANLEFVDAKQMPYVSKAIKQSCNWRILMESKVVRFPVAATKYFSTPSHFSLNPSYVYTISRKSRCSKTVSIVIACSRNIERKKKQNAQQWC